MKCYTVSSCRHVLLKAFLVQVLATLGTFAAPSPIIRFPGDDSVQRTDKEVALVSLTPLTPQRVTPAEPG